MMKRNILAVVIPALLAAGTANAAEIYNKDGNKLDMYGKVVGLHYLSKDKQEDENKSYASMSVKGETQITDQLTGYSQWEYNLETNHAESQGFKGDNYNQWEYSLDTNHAASQGSKGDRTSLAFVGLKFADYGSFDYGRNYGVLYNVESWTDSLPEFGGNTYSYADNFMTSRTSSVATYRNNNFFGLVDGLKLALQYQGKNTGGRLKEKNGEGWGISSTYEIGEGISIGAAYTASNRTEDQKLNDEKLGKKAEAWTVGTKYDANNVYLATMYAETRNMTPFGKNSHPYVNGITNKTYNFEVTAQYQFDFGLHPSVSYMQSKVKNINIADSESEQNLVKCISIGSTYELNKNMSTYVDYKINLLKDNEFTKATGTSTDNVIAVGLVYQF